MMETQQPAATTQQLTALFTSLTVAGAGFTGAAAVLSYAISVWMLVFLLSAVLVWLYLENLSLFDELKNVKLPSDTSHHVRRMQSETISEMAVEIKSLRYRNEQLQGTIGDMATEAKAIWDRRAELRGIAQTEKQHSLSLHHWKLIHRKALVMHYIMLFNRHKGEEESKRKPRTPYALKPRLHASYSLNDIRFAPDKSGSLEVTPTRRRLSLSLNDVPEPLGI